MSSEHRFPRSFTVAAWLIVVLLAVLVTQQVASRGDSWLSSAFAQQSPLVGARGIHAFPVQLDARTYGICMLDVDAGTLWVYEYVLPDRKLRLAAARSWISDRYLEEYNVAAPLPHEVARLVDQQTSLRTQRQSGTVSVTPEAKDQPAPQTAESPIEHKE